MERSQTRAMLIDALLLQAGWDVQNPEKVGQEVEVVFPIIRPVRVLWIMYSGATMASLWR